MHGGYETVSNMNQHYPWANNYISWVLSVSDICTLLSLIVNVLEIFYNNKKKNFGMSTWTKITYALYTQCERNQARPKSDLKKKEREKQGKACLLPFGGLLPV